MDYWWWIADRSIYRSHKLGVDKTPLSANAPYAVRGIKFEDLIFPFFIFVCGAATALPFL